MRAFLDRLYNAAGYLAALFLVGTLVMVLTGIAGRLMNFHVPGTDSYAGYCMAASGFLALAHTLKRGDHIRVTLILEHLGVRGRDHTGQARPRRDTGFHARIVARQRLRSGDRPRGNAR